MIDDVFVSNKPCLGWSWYLKKKDHRPYWLPVAATWNSWMGFLEQIIARLRVPKSPHVEILDLQIPSESFRLDTLGLSGTLNTPYLHGILQKKVPMYLGIWWFNWDRKVMKHWGMLRTRPFFLCTTNFLAHLRTWNSAFSGCRYCGVSTLIDSLQFLRVWHVLCIPAASINSCSML